MVLRPMPLPLATLLLAWPGVKLRGEVGSQVLAAKQSAGSAGKAGLWLLGSVSDCSPSSFPWAWGCCEEGWRQPIPGSLV